MTGTGAIDVPTGTTAQRPGSPTTGLFRYNSTEGEFEGYTASGWGAIAGGGGSGTDFTYLALRNASNNGAASYPASDFTLVTSGTTNAISPTQANALLVSYGGPWAENYYYATEEVQQDDKINRFTPKSELDRKSRRRNSGWFINCNGIRYKW